MLKLRARMARSAPFALTIATAILGAACFSAGGQVTGGETLVDSAAPPPAACVDDAGPDAAVTGPAATWPALYADFFGPTGKASCSLSGASCHGSADQEGAKASLYVCGDTIDTCYAGMTNPQAAIVESTGDPMGTTLYAILRKKCGGGSMPLEPKSASFDASDMARIAAWIDAGAPRN